MKLLTRIKNRLSPVMKINNLLRDHTGQAQAIAFGRIFKPKKKTAGYTAGQPN